ncbi:MAG TPA: diaminopimelate epimerase [Actinomycetota bacterium]|nr:diaminopimelate epimerase [Actinomycetota bacterium]
MKISKYHGTGNDFVFVEDLDGRLDIPPSFVAAVCDRHRGVGGDGLIRVVRGDARGGDGADFFMDYVNAEGAPAEMCGNGIRCLAVFAYERDLTAKTRLAVDTRAGLKLLELDVADGRVRSVTVDMGPPVLARAEIPMGGGDPAATVNAEPLEAAGRTWTMSAVSMGNPHCVLFLGDDDLGSIDVAGIGSEIEHLRLFPNRTNVEFVEVLDPSRIRMRVWERGVGETLACGTGACAALVASAVAGRTGRAAEVEVPGGRLQVDWREDGHVFLTGPATFVFDADLSDEWARAAGLSGVPTAAAS